MPIITFCKPDGSEITVDVRSGTSVMQAALFNGVHEIIGECGGALACATCHVHVDPADFAKLEAMDDQEAEMLDFAAAPRSAHSRLCCQIIMSDQLESVKVTPADPQV